MTTCDICGGRFNDTEHDEIDGEPVCPSCWKREGDAMPEPKLTDYILLRDMAIELLSKLDTAVGFAVAHPDFHKGATELIGRANLLLYATPSYAAVPDMAWWKIVGGDGT